MQRHNSDSTAWIYEYMYNIVNWKCPYQQTSRCACERVPARVYSYGPHIQILIDITY